MNPLPAYIAVVFAATTLLALWIFYGTIRQSSKPSVRQRTGLIIGGLMAWLAVQAVLSLQGVYYQNTDVMPPLLLIFGVLPCVITIALVFLTSGGRAFADSLPMKRLTWIHVLRIPVELVLFWLFVHGAIPKIMTFEGWNFDIVMGITAVLVIVLAFQQDVIGRLGLLAWNLVGLIFLSFIVGLAILSAPFPLQQLAYGQPNVGVLYFPFSWLPTFVVPVVALAHLVSIRQLWRQQ